MCVCCVVLPWVDNTEGEIARFIFGNSLSLEYTFISLTILLGKETRHIRRTWKIENLLVAFVCAIDFTNQLERGWHTSRRG